MRATISTVPTVKDKAKMTAAKAARAAGIEGTSPHGGTLPAARRGADGTNGGRRYPAVPNRPAPFANVAGASFANGDLVLAAAGGSGVTLD